MTRKIAAALAAVGVLAAGCSGDDPPRMTTRTPVSAPAETAAEPTTEPTAEPVEETPDPKSEENTRTIPIDVEWEDSGVTLRFSTLVIGPVEVFEANGLLVEEGTETVVVFDGAVENGRDESIEFYPYQGVLVVGPDQIDSDLWEGSLGGTIHDGVTTEGTIVFQSPRDMAWFDEQEDLRLLIDGAFSSDTYETVTDEIDLRIPLGQS